jgi:signal transduction histidine kinase
MSLGYAPGIAASLHAKGLFKWPDSWPAVLRQVTATTRLEGATAYRLFLAPRSRSEEARRREFIANVLLCGLTLITVIKLAYLILHPGQVGLDQGEDSLVGDGLVLLISTSLWKLSRAGRYTLAAGSLLGLLAAEAVRLTLRWSFELPVSELMYALAIVVAGVVLTMRAALLVSSSLLLVLLTISYYQLHDHLQPATSWLQQDFQMLDAISYAAILGVIALVAWLANREICQSLGRARTSEAVLVRQRDTLEARFAERTRELQNLQLLRIGELQRFAEFGRLSANLLHEVGNPLTAALLNLSQIEDQSSELVLQAERSLRQLERYVEAARKQVTRQGLQTRFNVRQELNQVACIMRPLAQQAAISLVIRPPAAGSLRGDPIKFNQLVANLIANAIDAYKDYESRNEAKAVTVTAVRQPKWLCLTVQDHGKGIAAAELPHLFDPFYTTKVASGRSLGIGLTMVRQIVTQDFRGQVRVVSSPGQGTSFTVKLRLPEERSAGTTTTVP